MIAVCKVLKAHGVKGDLKVECYTDSPEVLSKIKKFYSGNSEYKAERVKPFGNFALIKLVGVNNMTEADAFRNMIFYVSKNDMPPLNQGTFYIDDLIGSTVVDDKGLNIGKITNVLQYGSADVFHIKENGKVIMFPHLKKVVNAVDVVHKIVTVNRTEFDKVAVYED